MIVGLPESLVVAAVHQFFAAQVSSVWTEVPIMGKSADLVAIVEQDVYAVEAKVKNWRRALDQALPHLLVADYVYIAIATKEVSSTLLSIATENGLGVLHVSRHGECTVALPPTRSTRIWGPQKSILLKTLLEIDHDY